MMRFPRNFDVQEVTYKLGCLEGEEMFKMPRQEYMAESTELAVKRFNDDEGIAAVARDLGLVEQTLRDWVQSASSGKFNAPRARKAAPEQTEVPRLRAENAHLRMENEILKKATAYFARDAL